MSVELVFGRDLEAKQFVEQALSIVISPPYVAIGVSRDGGRTLCGGVVFNRWNFHNIDITLVAKGCFTRRLIRRVYYYVFVALRARRVTAMTRRSNETMRALLPRLGFTREAEGVLRRYYGSDKADDAFIHALFPEQARKWL